MGDGKGDWWMESGEKNPAVANSRWELKVWLLPSRVRRYLQAQGRG
jgi:hypothetical protein